MIPLARVLLAAFVIAVVLVCLPVESTAQAASPKRVLVFPLSGSVPGDKGGDAIGRLTQVVARSAGLTGAEVTVGEVTFEDASTMAGCAATGADCLAQVAKALHVDHVVLGSVEAGADAGHVKVTLIAYVNEVVSERSFELSAASIDGMVEQLAREAPALFVGEKPAASATQPSEPPAPAPAPVEPPAPVAPAGPSGFARVSTTTWIITGGGAALLGTGAVLLALASSKQNEVNAAPTETPADLDRLATLEDEGARLTTAGDVLVIGGGAVFLAGAAIAIYQATSGPDEPAGARDKRVSVRPLWLGRGGGLSVELSWP
jgi:hypothetical protein